MNLLNQDFELMDKFKKMLFLLLAFTEQSVFAELDGRGSAYWQGLVQRKIGYQAYAQLESQNTVYKNGPLILEIANYDWVIYNETIYKEFSLNRKLESIESALIEGANPNTLVTPTHTALTFAASKGYSELIKILIKYKADLSLKDTAGKTALEYARENGHSECIALLEKSAKQIS